MNSVSRARAPAKLAGERGREFSLEYELARDWKFRATTNPNGSNGVDIIWHKQY